MFKKKARGSKVGKKTSGGPPSAKKFPASSGQGGPQNRFPKASRPSPTGGMMGLGGPSC
jgi:hypothetical protein